MPSPKARSVASEEIARFSRDAEAWWNPDGPFRPLHQLNPLRMSYVRDMAATHFDRDSQLPASLKGLTVLDVGCGGGLLTEPLARLGARVTGLDASGEAIAVAKRHAKEVRLAIDYHTGSVEELARHKNRYDMITALEIAEHVADLDSFLISIAALLKPKGLLIMSTLNRTPKSFLLGILAAEYILGWIPRGTHQWNKFIQPAELAERLEKARIRVTEFKGLAFNPMRGTFELRAHDLAVNYFVTATLA